MSAGQEKEMEVRPYEDPDELAVIALWGEVLPANAPHNDPAAAISRLRLGLTYCGIERC